MNDTPQYKNEHLDDMPLFKTEDETVVAEKIVHLLTMFPVISPTMLQAGLGPSTKPSLWRPVLETLIEAKKVHRADEQALTPTNRYNTYTKLMIPGTVVQRHGK